MDNKPNHDFDRDRKKHLALHIRRLRQWYGDNPISQNELSRVAGVPIRSLRTLEGCRSVPRAVESLLRVSLALGVPVEKLVDPGCRDDIRRSVVPPSPSHDKGNGPRPDAAAKEAAPYRPVLAACHRKPYLSMAVLNGVDVLEVLRARTPRTESLCAIIDRIAADYGCQTVLVEPHRHLFNEVKSLQCDVRTLALAKAKTLLLPGRARVTHRDLYQHLVAVDPRLRRFVTIFPATGRVAVSEPWKTVNLLAIALGRAYAREERPA